MTMPDRKTGTREWSEHSANCCLGCSHGCLYCYARAAALRWDKIDSGEDWMHEQPNFAAAMARQPKHKGVVMFPTAHDITPGNAAACLAMLTNLLMAGNRVLVVSKAGMHVPSLMVAASHLADNRGHIELRVTLTACQQRYGDFWEPGAPSAYIRLAAIREAAALGIPVSVAIEPCLDVDHLHVFIDEARKNGADGEIWIGAANKLRQRTAWCKGRPGLEAEIARIEAGQTAEPMREVYESLRGDPQIRWKDSYQAALGIDALGRRAKR